METVPGQGAAMEMVQVRGVAVILPEQEMELVQQQIRFAAFVAEAEKLPVHGAAEQERCPRRVRVTPAEPVAEAERWIVWDVLEQVLRWVLVITAEILRGRVRRGKIVTSAMEAEKLSVHGAAEQERCLRRV